MGKLLVPIINLLKLSNAFESFLRKDRTGEIEESCWLETFKENGKISEIFKSFEPYIYNIWNLKSADKVQKK